MKIQIKSQEQIESLYQNMIAEQRLEDDKYCLEQMDKTINVLLQNNQDGFEEKNESFIYLNDKGELENLTIKYKTI